MFKQLAQNFSIHCFNKNCKAIMTMAHSTPQQSHGMAAIPKIKDSSRTANTVQWQKWKIYIFFNFEKKLVWNKSRSGCCAQLSIKRVNQTKCWTKGESDVDKQNLGETIDQKSKLPLQCFKLLVNIVSPFFWVWKMKSTNPIPTKY